jgi:hypothetical protein
VARSGSDFRPIRTAKSRARASDSIPSPGFVLWEIGRVIAVCLGLAVAPNLLVAVLPGP